MVLNVSSVKLFQKCRLRWLYEFVYGRVPRKGSLPLEFGKLLHIVFEYHVRDGLAMGEAIDVAIADWQARMVSAEYLDRLAGEEACAELHSMREPLSLWTDQYPMTTLAVEEPFEYPHPTEPGLSIKGRPDREVLCFGKLWHVQNRSLNAGKKILLYSELMKSDLHELTYAWALPQKYPQYEYGGTIFNIVRKLKYRGKPTKAVPEGKILHTLDEIMGQIAVPMLETQKAHALMDLAWIGREMDHVIQEAHEGRFPARNRDMDGGPFGNSKDPYWPVFMGEADLFDDTLFKSREDPYAPSALEV